MDKKASIRKQVLNNFEQMFKDIDKAIKMAGSEEEFNAFCEKSLEFYKGNVGKQVDFDSVPDWESTVLLPNKYLFGVALYYLIFKHECSKGYIDSVLQEEFNHADEAVNEDCDYEFALRFYKDKDDHTWVEPATLVYVPDVKGDQESKEKMTKKVKKIASSEGSSSKWDAEIQDLD
jgi:hypothetical protein